MARPRSKKQFVAYWRDDTGRHRLRFATQVEADAHKSRMLALRAAKQLGMQIARGAGKGPGSTTIIHSLARKCSKIAHMTALKISLEQPAQISA